MPVRAALPLALLALLFFPACGGGGDEEPIVDETADDGAPTTDGGDSGGCPWLTDGEASDAAGAEVTVTAVDPNSCQITSADGTTDGSVLVLDLNSPTMQIVGGVEAEVRGGAARVNRLGERASWVRVMGGADGDVSGRLVIEQDGRAITIMLSRTPATPELRPMMEGMGRAVVDHL